ncbi:alpha/beta fold hydrolase [Halorarius litoreus]|uniref:alpha/beta fold hydrolase n=1 Tax=Halorarius litoreus TaxID=2962676 RepID=UPI0020CE0E45|nr:alpha/beta fold hydrolase [Halorarius litoreus]
MEVEANGLTFECREWGSGETVLCMHGFPDDPGTFEVLADRLDGYHLVAPYSRGYGPTDAPEDGDFSPRALGSDIVALGDALDARYLVGHDWGAVGTYGALAQDHPFERAVTMAVPPRFDALLFAYPTQFLRSWYIWLFQFPGVAERLLRRNDFAFIELTWGVFAPGWDYPDHRIESVKETFRTGETVEHALQYYRDMTNETIHALARRGIRSPDEGQPFDTPTLVMGGERDGCMEPKMLDHVGAAFEESRVLRLRDTGHFMHWERPDVVADEVADWLA